MKYQELRKVHRAYEVSRACRACRACRVRRSFRSSRERALHCTITRVFFQTIELTVDDNGTSSRESEQVKVSQSDRYRGPI